MVVSVPEVTRYPAQPFPLGLRGRRAAWVAAAGLVLACGADPGSGPRPGQVDAELADVLAAGGVQTLAPPPVPAGNLVELGRLLMFDKILSGNKDIACSTCHNPVYHATDNLTLPIGTGGRRVGPARQLASGRIIGRNSGDLYNRSLPGWSSLFWDGRVGREGSVIQTPAGQHLPPGTSLLAAQAMFPVTVREEMLGYPGDTTRSGEINELATLPDGDFHGVWNGLMRRVLAIPEYVELFRSAFPEVDSADLGFHHATTAIAAFETAVFTHLNTPFDRYVAGDRAALSDSAKRGALLFYGRARCAGCHVGSLLTDQKFHNIGAPQLGPGMAPGAPWDLGREGVTGDPGDRFAFRTPSLRNVALTGPWMHNGAYATLKASVRHYRNPASALRQFDESQLDPRFRGMLHRDPATLDEIVATLDPLLPADLSLSDSDVAELVAFLLALTDQAAVNQVREIPHRVPSRIPVFE